MIQRIESRIGTLRHWDTLSAPFSLSVCWPVFLQVLPSSWKIRVAFSNFFVTEKNRHNSSHTLLFRLLCFFTAFHSDCTSQHNFLYCHYSSVTIQFITAKFQECGLLYLLDAECRRKGGTEANFLSNVKASSRMRCTTNFKNARPKLQIASWIPI